MQKTFNMEMNIAKALGIFAIVAGHVNWNIYGDFISDYSFHIPLFFFISGYFFKSEIFDGISKIKNFFTYTKKIITKYLSRFYSYHILYGLITWIVFISCHRLYGQLPTLKNLTLSPIDSTPFGFSVPNWFLYQLTISLIFFSAVIFISRSFKMPPIRLIFIFFTTGNYFNPIIKK